MVVDILAVVVVVLVDILVVGEEVDNSEVVLVVVVDLIFPFDDFRIKKEIEEGKEKRKRYVAAVA